MSPALFCLCVVMGMAIGLALYALYCLFKPPSWWRW